MTAFYNEIDPYAAEWLRNLIAGGHIAPGVVDRRSIVDLQPADLVGYRQCHFFAGIGGWSYAARLAGWPDDRPLWTGSCPCQPFSVAGAGKAQADTRHLWPELFRLTAALRPAVLMGEQVAAAIGKDWLDGVHADLEGIGYATRAAVVPACAVDAPHRRDRLWFVADSDGSGSGARRGDAGQVRGVPEAQCEPEHSAALFGRSGGARHDGLADADSAAIRDESGRCGGPSGSGARIDRDTRQGNVANGTSVRGQVDPDAGGRSAGSGAGELAESRRTGNGDVGDGDGEGLEIGSRPADERGALRSEGPTAAEAGDRSAWRGAAWIAGADGKARRVKPGIRLLAHGVPARVGKLRALGNAIVPQVAAEVIAAYMAGLNVDFSE